MKSGVDPPLGRMLTEVLWRDDGVRYESEYTLVVVFDVADGDARSLACEAGEGWYIVSRRRAYSGI